MKQKHLTGNRLYNYHSIKELYNTHWATEEEFKKLMEFYRIFMRNLVSILTRKTNEEVFQQSKNLKYRRQINWTSALGDVRKRFVLQFL